MASGSHSSGVRRVSWCGNWDEHEPHEYQGGGMFMPRTAQQCEGIREQSLRLWGIKAWTRLRDEIVPIFRTQFPGVLITADEKVIYSTIPNVEWKGAELTMLGLPLRSADFILHTLMRELDYGLNERNEIRNLNDAETAAVAHYRESRNKS